MQNLTYTELSALLRTVFGLREEEGDLVFLLDVPGQRLPDTAAWKDRRRITAEWFVMLQQNAGALPFRAIHLCSYESVGSGNADLPSSIDVVASISVHDGAYPAGPVPLVEILKRSSVVIAPTQFSATAPLKVLARTYPFRGATLPNFLRTMIPAFGLDYESVDRRVRQLQSRMDRAQHAEIVFRSEGREDRLTLDLRFRTAHASGGLMRDPGVVANLPSGEAYVVPYEGERRGEPSMSSGVLPVQFGKEIVSFRVEGNRCREVLSSGPASDLERHKLIDDPAYGNLAELGIGVLSEFGITAVGSTLLDEKLGLHIAFGRSDHFGGSIGPAQFRRAENVVHIDWVYVPSIQPGIQVQSVTFAYKDAESEIIIADDRIVV